MNALPRYDYPPTPPDPTPRKKVRRRPRRDPHQATIAETSFKLGVNAVLAIVAITALVRLVPYNLAQQTKLQEIRAEVSDLEGRVGQLRADLSRQFDPQQAMSVMREESMRVDPRQRQVIWLPPSSSTAQAPPSTRSARQEVATANVKRSGSTDPAFYPPSASEEKP
ncbi:MAG TPA: hypothetical protein V6C57_13230 [Coleofasciculaceae cyanobacterium]